MYPSYVTELPSGKGKLTILPFPSETLVFIEKGKFLALDLGGTNYRVLLMSFSGNPEHPPRKIEEFYQIPTDKMTGTSKSVS